HRVPRVGRHHRRAQLDPWHLAARDRQGGQRIQTEDVGHPGRGESVVGRALQFLAQPDQGVGAGRLGRGRAYAHASSPFAGPRPDLPAPAWRPQDARSAAAQPALPAPPVPSARPAAPGPPPRSACAARAGRPYDGDRIPLTRAEVIMAPDVPPSGLTVRPLERADAEAITAWRYEGPWDVYNSRPGELLS